MIEAEYVEGTPEQASKKAKKSKADASQENTSDTEDASEVLDKRTRSKKPADNAQSSKKRKMVIKKLRQASLAADIAEEEST